MLILQRGHELRTEGSDDRGRELPQLPPPSSGGRLLSFSQQTLTKMSVMCQGQLGIGLQGNKTANILQVLWKKKASVETN